MKHLLLLHGALGSKKQFVELEKHLTEDFKTYSMDFSGHGGSEIPHEPFSINMFAQNILQFVNENKIPQIDIFGYSMGGYAALQFAKDNPERAGRIFTLATKFEWTNEIASREVKMLDAEKIQAKVPVFVEELKQRHSPQSWETILAKTAEMMANLGNEGESSSGYPLDVNDITNEVQIAVGDKDKMVSIAESEIVSKKLRNGRFLILEDTLHPLEQVDKINLSEHIKNFFT